MKKNVTYVDAAKFESIIVAKMEEHGLKAELQKGFVKVSGQKGRNVYVAATKTVARVDLSGFTMELEGVVAHSKGTFGAVEQELDFSRSEEQILETFSAVLDHMASLPEREVVRKRRQDDSGAQGWSGLIAAPQAA